MSEMTDSQPQWYTLTTEDVSSELQVDPTEGLSTSEAEQRLGKYGPNQLEDKKKEPGWQAFLRQYQDLMQIILLGAAIINQIFTGELGTTLVLVGLTIFNAVLGLRGEAKAEASLAALAGAMKSIARVRRDGQAVEVDAGELVPGDIVLMEAGNLVPSDGRLFVTATLEIEEAALTGESVASPKDTETIQDADAPLGDRHCMAYMNTSVTRGRGEMIVTTTGMGTEMGHIADLLNKTEADKTPLQKQLDRLTMIIAGLAGLAFIAMIVLGIINDQPMETIFISGVALAISAIPTGLPAVVTTMYSLGTRALARQNAIVKRLPSVETLGSVSAICSDKTGTLTLNKMTAREFTIPGQNRFTVTGEGYRTQGDYTLASGDAEGHPFKKGTLAYSTEGNLQSAGGTRVDLDQVMLPMALCADATLDNGALIGDPTEGALIVLAEKGGISVDGAREMYPRVAEVPFDSDYKFMIDLINDLTLLAMVGIVDPPRAEARDAIAKCHSAGIQVRMITGDHAVTATAIGHELGIEGMALTGAEFAATSDEELKGKLPEIGVVARVAPEDKIRLVTLLQEQENIVAMTGDGVNDAPALKKADIGVAMGITGTEGLALGFDKPASDLMENKPRPLKQPILSRPQWVRIGFIGLITAIVTVYLEAMFEPGGAEVAATMGFVVFSLLFIVLGLSARSETDSAFNRDIFQSSQQLLLYGFALLITILPTRLAFLQDFLGLTELATEQWLICIVVAVAVLLVDEVIKIFMRRSR